MDIDIGIQKPKSYKLEGQDEYIRFVLEKMDSSHEGIVVCDRYFNRIKLKTEHYLELAHRISLVMKGSAVNAVSIFKVIKQNEQSEFLSYFPEMKKYFDSVEAGMKAAELKTQEIDEFARTWKEDNPTSNKKEFVAFVNETIKDKQYIPLYYSAYYDEVEICAGSSEAHPKSAIQIRNRSRVDRSDLIICCIQHKSGGAYATIGSRSRDTFLR